MLKIVDNGMKRRSKITFISHRIDVNVINP